MKQLLIITLIVALVETQPLYDTGDSVNEIISFLLYAVMQDPAILYKIEPLQFSSLVKNPFIELPSLTLRGLSNVTCGNESKFTFDGENIGVNLVAFSNRIEADLGFILYLPFFTPTGTVRVVIDALQIYSLFNLPTNQSGPIRLEVLRFPRLDNFRTLEDWAILNGILNSEFFKDVILGSLAMNVKSQINKNLLNVTLPWFDQSLKQSLKDGVTDTGFIIA